MRVFITPVSLQCAWVEFIRRRSGIGRCCRNWKQADGASSTGVCLSLRALFSFKVVRVTPHRHTGNSAAALLNGEALTNTNMVRTGARVLLEFGCLANTCPSRVSTGIALYGCAPGPDVPMLPGMSHAITWTTSVAQVPC